MIKKLFTSLFLFVFLLNAQVFAETYKNEFISIKFPKQWQINEINTRKIKANLEESKISANIIINIKKIPWYTRLLAGEVSLDDMVNFQEVAQDQNMELLASGNTVVDQEKALWGKFFKPYTYKGIQVHTILHQTYIIHGNNMFIITSGVGAATKKKALTHYRYLEPTFKKIIKSLRFQDWETAKEAAQENKIRLFWISILISLILTWGIGLSIPLLLRFLILRKPISKTHSLITVSILFVINLIIFVSLGSESKSHIALVLVAFVSYWILNKGYVEETNKNKEQ